MFQFGKERFEVREGVAVGLNESFAFCPQVGAGSGSGAERLEAGLDLEAGLGDDDGLRRTGWHIPRPSLTPSSASSPTSTAFAEDGCMCHKAGRHSTSSQGSSASSSSSTSGASTQVRECSTFRAQNTARGGEVDRGPGSMHHI